MTPLAEIKWRLWMATPGQWMVTPHNVYDKFISVERKDGGCWGGPALCKVQNDDEPNGESNADLIANAPSDLAYLIARVEALQEVYEAAQEERRIEYGPKLREALKVVEWMK